MKLIHAAASPFVRKARILILELGLQDKVELINPGAVTPVSNNQDLNQLNPLGMIPTLVLDDGSSLYDSTVICEYLNHIGDGQFFPQETAQRFRSLKLQSLGDGIMDLSVAVRYETALRPAELHWADWIEHQNEKILRGLSSLEQMCSQFSQQLTIGEVAAGCALGYRDFRFGDHDWRKDYPALSNWYSNLMERPSFQSTVPA